MAVNDAPVCFLVVFYFHTSIDKFSFQTHGRLFFRGILGEMAKNRRSESLHNRVSNTQPPDPEPDTLPVELRALLSDQETETKLRERERERERERGRKGGRERERERGRELIILCSYDSR